jgi:IS30 family transposase
MAGPKKYCRLTKADRHAIQAALDTRGSCRSIAEGLGRSPSTVFCEVKRNRVVKRGPGKGEKAADVPEDACPKLLSWPYVCNGCRLRNYHCPKRWQAEYRAARAQARADEELSASRRGIDKTREQFERIMGCVKEGLARGLSPEQIVASYALDVSPATIYRWIEEGYAGTGNIELRRKLSYKPRKKKAAPRSTSHGAERSYAAFLGLGEEERSSACEMDTVIGRVHDSKCLLTLYLRPCKFQLMLLLGGKTAEEAARALDALEEAVGVDGFGRLFDPILTDNGAEFSDHGLIERSAGDSAARRARVFCCDVRQSHVNGNLEATSQGKAIFQPEQCASTIQVNTVSPSRAARIRSVRICGDGSGGSQDGDQPDRRDGYAQGDGRAPQLLGDGTQIRDGPAYGREVLEGRRRDGGQALCKAQRLRQIQG